SGLSGSVQAAEFARNEVAPDRIFIVDSKNLSSGVGLLVLKAKDLRDQGFSAQEIKRKLDQMVPFVRTYFIIPNLEYLSMANRLTNLQKLIGNMIKIKPVITIKNGDVVVFKKPSGSMIKAIGVLTKQLEKDADFIDKDYMMVTHSYATKSSKYLNDFITEKFEIRNIVDSYAGCVISAHIGKGSIGISYLIR
ncbi:MAG: DegV family protein, partial [Acholeplasmataceae bacterium]|nr:DegV family protein [Acholeplasmataceae bacterium]